MTITTNPDSQAISLGALGPEAEYWRRLGEGVFAIQRCVACLRYFFYPRALCRYCGSPHLTWHRPQGSATVYSTSVVRRKAEEGGNYNVAIIELGEGVRMMSRVENIDPFDVHIGMSVVPQINGIGSEAVLVFVPAAAGDAHD